MCGSGAQKKQKEGQPNRAQHLHGASDDKWNDRDAGGVKWANKNSNEVYLPIWFLLLCALSLMGASVGAGYLYSSSCRPAAPITLAAEDGEPGQPQQCGAMPEISLPGLKAIPQARYTEKEFYESSANDPGVVISKRPSKESGHADGIKGEVNPLVTIGAPIRDIKEEVGEQVYKPSGQHLMVDLQHVDSAFLSNEQRVARAMLELVEASELTLLSYHCHTLRTPGVTCIGILLESHVSVHTWPVQGAIMLDLFTCGDKSLLGLIPVVRELFAKRQSSCRIDDIVNGRADGREAPPYIEPSILWSHKKRGFRRSEDERDDGLFNLAQNAVDIDHHLLGWRDYSMKEHIASVQTDYQSIEIYDVIDPRFRPPRLYKGAKSSHNNVAMDGNTSGAKNSHGQEDQSYVSLHPELFQADRIIYLDGIMQSRRFGEASYHEALVHPAVFAHSNPARVAIVGGGEGATLREVLKHSTVAHVDMIEIDKQMVEASRTYLPEWSDCGDLDFGGSANTAESCFDDPRVSLHYADAVSWFLERFLDRNEDDSSIADEGEDCYDNDDDLFDVIIMDALDPSSDVEFSDSLYGNDNVVRAMYSALSEDGILVSQVGDDDELVRPARTHSEQAQLDAFIDSMEAAGFDSVKEYSEAHGGFLDVRKFLVAFKTEETKVAWFKNQAQVDKEIRARIVPSKSWRRGHPLRHYDGATQQGYQYESRIDEEMYCRREPTPSSCLAGHGFDPARGNAPITSLEVRKSNIPNAGRGVFFKEAFPEGTYIAIEECANGMLIPPLTYSLIREISEDEATNDRQEDSNNNKLQQTGWWDVFEPYYFGYGFSSDFFGSTCYFVDPGILTFVNHGCNNTNTMGWTYNFTELTVDLYTMPDELANDPFERSVYNPFAVRNFMPHMLNDYTRMDVAPGTELLDNYLDYISDENWHDAVQDYRAQCLAQSTGAISRYERTQEDRG